MVHPSGSTEFSKSMYLFRFDVEVRGTSPSKLSVVVTAETPDSAISYEKTFKIYPEALFTACQLAVKEWSVISVAGRAIGGSMVEYAVAMPHSEKRSVIKFFIV